MNKFVLKSSIITFVTVILLTVAITGSIDKVSEQYTGDAFKRALITFGVARGLNGVISVAQGTEVALHPAGLGVNFAPGQILDPINDLVEQFSWVMLASSASLGIQKVLLTVSSTLVITLLFIFVLTAYLVSLWRPNLFNREMSRLIISTAMIMVFIRFSVPVVAIASEGMYRLFLEEQYIESSTSLDQTKTDISKLSEEENKAFTDSEEGIVEKAKKFFSATSDTFSIDKQIAKYQEIAADTTKHAIHIIVVFVLQTILIPLLFLWLSYRGLKILWNKVLVT